MLNIHSRIDDYVMEAAKRNPLPKSSRRVRAVVKDGIPKLEGSTKDGKWKSLTKATAVKIDWSFLSIPEKPVRVHQLLTSTASRVILDDLGDVDEVLKGKESFVTLETELGFPIYVPLYDTRLYEFVVDVKFK